MIIDCFTFYNEIDLLEIRLNELDRVVAKFVLVEAERTHQNKPKKLYYDELKDSERFAKFKSKIIHIVVPGDKFNDDAWHNEKLQRSYIQHGLQEYNDDAILIVSDLDEIPSCESVERALKLDLKDPVVFEHDLFYYKLNTKLYSNGSCKNHGAVMLLKRDFLQDTEKVRNSCKHSFYKIDNAGWHFSYAGDSNFIFNKLQNFAHTEFKNLTKEDVCNRLLQQSDLFGRDDHTVQVCKDLSYLPKHVQDNLDSFKHLLDKLVIVQLGACRGNDHVTKLINNSSKPCDVLLYEANRFNIQPLQECYKNEKMCKIHNTAIVVDESQKEVTFYYSKDDGPGYEVSSIKKEHVLDYYGESCINSYTIECTTLNNIFKHNELHHVDYLFIDIEGIDADIILNFPIEDYDIKNIQIEYLHLKDKQESVENKMHGLNYTKHNGLDEQQYDKLFSK